MTLDFAKGYKTISGLVLLAVATFLPEMFGEGELSTILYNIGQVVGLLLTVYGLVMKVVRRLK